MMEALPTGIRTAEVIAIQIQTLASITTMQSKMSY